MQGRVFVIEASTFVLVPGGRDVEKIAAEHGGDLVGHFPDAEMLDTKVHAILPRRPRNSPRLGG